MCVLLSLLWGKSAVGLRGALTLAGFQFLSVRCRQSPQLPSPGGWYFCLLQVAVLQSAGWPCIFTHQIRGPVIITLCTCRFCLMYADLEFHLVAFVYREHSF